MSLGLVHRTHKFIDLIGGVAAGVYRTSMRPGETGKNVDAHYISGAANAPARLKAAMTEPMPSAFYPTLFWAERFLADVASPHICDFGGGYGEACVRIGRMQNNARFSVVEVPDLVKAMKSISPPNLDYLDTPPASCDLLFSNGVTMNAPDAVFSCVEQVDAKALIITGVEVTAQDTFWSMQVNRRFGRRCPYVTFNENEFVSRISSFGYALCDTWTMGTADSGVFLDGRSQPEYRGFAFTATQ